MNWKNLVAISLCAFVGSALAQEDLGAIDRPDVRTVIEKVARPVAVRAQPCLASERGNAPATDENPAEAMKCVEYRRDSKDPEQRLEMLRTPPGH